MANKAISELPQAQNVNNQDLFVLEQSGIAKKLTAETFITEQGIIDALAEALDGHGGISSVTLSSVSGRIRTYRITFTDQSATTFQVYDGTSIDRISRTSSSGLDDVYTIFLSDGTTTFFTVHNGADGDVSEAMLNDALKNKAPAITETTESSAIATFTDGADDMPLHSILAEINPVQDLNGYDNPWPAGGGKNKLPPGNAGTASNNGVTYASDGNGSYTLSGTATADSAIKYTLPTPYTIVSGDYLHMMNLTANTNTGMTLDFDDGTTAFPTFSSASRIFDLASRVGKTIMAIGFTVGNGNAYSGTITPMVINSATPTTFAPYSNICPISGWAGANVTRTGKNLFDQATVLSGLGFGLQSDGSWLYTGNSYWPAYQQKVWENATGYTGQIAVSLDVKYGTSGKIGLYFKFVYTDGTMESILGSATGDFVSTSAVSNASKTVDYIMTYFSYNVADTSTAFKNVQLELGSTATTYEPYIAPTTVSLSWQTEAGTVYGGSIDVATGLLTVDRAMVDLGTLSYSLWNSTSVRDCYSFLFTDIKPQSSNYENINALSTIFVATSYNAPWEPWQMSYTNTSKQVVFIVPHGNYATTEDFAAAMSGVMFCYELANPQTYQLTPQEVCTLLGTNNVWADTGNVSVTYPADTRMFIEKLTMPTEDDLVANQAITSGKYFMVGNSLYLALANIASGAQITIGTNAQRVSLADALNTINA